MKTAAAAARAKAPPAAALRLHKLDRVIHERIRLGIMTLLATRPRWGFADLKAELRLSDGNLLSHLRTLHQAGYVEVIKEVLDRPQTSYALTPRGRQAFQEHVAVLEEIVRAGRC